MKFLVLQHLSIEPPLMIGSVIADAGHTLEVVQRDQGQQMQGRLEAYDGLIVMGGPQSANDSTAMIREDLSIVRRAIGAEMPMLGVCLGAQLMAKASGAEVVASPVRELGWWPVFRTAAGSEDRLFSHMPECLQVFQWHGETFSCSDQMTMLATHPDVPAQAFRLGALQYGMQFHLEVDRQTIAQWIHAGESERRDLGEAGIAQIWVDAERYLEAGRRCCARMVRAWLEGMTAAL